MKATLILILVFFACLMFSCGQRQSMEMKYYPVKPSVFLLLRDKTIVHELDDWSAVIEAAIPDSMAGKGLSNLKDWENVIIVDEDQYWAVSFHQRGNGMISYDESVYGLNGWNMTIEDGEGFVVYLDKKTLQIMDGPENKITTAPVPWDSRNSLEP